MVGSLLSLPAYGLAYALRTRLIAAIYIFRKIRALHENYADGSGYNLVIVYRS